jgi:N6-L-threonylcarbamoyladenine synthase/N6-L-threonylcarbamoyladenine synthase/protein kinase Bud32
LGGGVACNTRLQEMAMKMCEERPERLDDKEVGETKFFCPERSLLVDNGAMIAYLGEIIFNSEVKMSCSNGGHIVWGEKNIKKVDILPKQRTDQVNVTWR